MRKIEDFFNFTPDVSVQFLHIYVVIVSFKCYKLRRHEYVMAQRPFMIVCYYLSHLLLISEIFSQLSNQGVF